MLTSFSIVTYFYNKKLARDYLFHIFIFSASLAFYCLCGYTIKVYKYFVTEQTSSSRIRRCSKIRIIYYTVYSLYLLTFAEQQATRGLENHLIKRANVYY